MHLCIDGKLLETENIEEQRGTFQGGSLSLLLFCISYIFLTEQLKKLNTRYERHTIKTSTTVDLLDDLNKISKTKQELQK